MLFQSAVKRRLDTDPRCSSRQAYNAELNQRPVNAAAVSVPLASIERSLQRYTVRNRPPLPATRQDWVLQPGQMQTTDGRHLLLIDDGLGDRLLVFGTPENLQR